MAKRQLDFPRKPLQMTPGTFFETDDGNVWRLEALETRWTIRNVCLGALGEPRNVPANFACTILRERDVHEDVLEALYERCFETEAGSEHGAIHDNDMSGAWSVDSSVVTTQETFRKTLRATGATIRALREMWGDAFVATFFIGLETLGGHYDAEWEEYTEPGHTEYGAPHMSRGFNDGEGPMCDESRGQERPPYVRGSKPNLEKYHDASEPKTVLPLLRAFKNVELLMKIKEKARNPAVREAAGLVLAERSRKAKTARP